MLDQKDHFFEGIALAYILDFSGKRTGTCLTFEASADGSNPKDIYITESHALTLNAMNSLKASVASLHVTTRNTSKANGKLHKETKDLRQEVLHLIGQLAHQVADTSALTEELKDGKDNVRSVTKVYIELCEEGGEGKVKMLGTRRRLWT